MNKDIQEILFSEEEIELMVNRVAEEINKDYAGKEILLVGLLKGSAVFISDLMRKINVGCSIDFMRVSSYGRSTKSSGMVNVKMDLSEDIKGRHVLIVEDIIDSGNTLAAVLELLSSREPASLKLCALLSKPSRREVEIKIDYHSEAIPTYIYISAFSSRFGEFFTGSSKSVLYVDEFRLNY